ncbi:MAG: GDP-mannose 4,6-dehydratase [Gemmatimonadales bacterium]
MRILVTGAAGFIGSHLVERLLAGGATVLGLDCFDDFYDPAVKRQNLSWAMERPEFRLIEGDIRDEDLLGRAIPESVECIVHLAARPGVRPSIEQPLLYQDVNVRGTQVLLEYAREMEVGRFVFGSSSSVYGNSSEVPFSEDDFAGRPISPYAATKRQGELLCHAYHHLFGLGIMALRFFTVYGPRQRPDLAIHRFTRLLSEGKSIQQYGAGTTSRDYTYVDDIVQGIVGAIRYLEDVPDAYEIVNLGESETVELSELIGLIADELGVTPEIERLPPQPGDVEQTFADVSKARRLLAYDPRVGIEEGIARFVRWYSERA